MAIQITSSPGFFNKRDIIIRHCIIFVLALFFTIVGKLDETLTEQFRKFISTFINIILIWNGNILLIELFDRELTWEKNIRHKLIVSGLIAILWPIIVHITYGIFIFPLIQGKPCDLTSKENISYLIISIAITLFINSVFVSMAFFKSWRQTLQEKEELKRERINAEFATLKNQINPHFLFNSLNTLTSLIEENPKTATDFVQKLSSVYRYVLTQKDKDIIPLSEELTFIQSYIYLNQIRFGDNLRTHIHIEPKYLNSKIVTLCLQMLIENCVKHNIISGDKPLTIYIGVFNNKIFVRNNLQPKITVNSDSNGIGLHNIVHRYSLLTNEEVEILEDGKDFMVSLPLLP
jgi:sensor histidine kinase YesM